MNYTEISKEWEEVQRTIETFNKKGYNVEWNKMLVDLQESSTVVLDDVIWSRTENTDSTDVNKWDFSYFRRLMEEKTDMITLFFKILLGFPTDKPIIWKYKPQKYYLISGNSRLCIYKILGKRPKVILSSNKHVKLEEGLNERLVS